MFFLLYLHIFKKGNKNKKRSLRLAVESLLWFDDVYGLVVHGIDELLAVLQKSVLFNCLRIAPAQLYHVMVLVTKHNIYQVLVSQADCETELASGEGLAWRKEVLECGLSVSLDHLVDSEGGELATTKKQSDYDLDNNNSKKLRNSQKVELTF